jgi:hypothetical protein
MQVTLDDRHSSFATFCNDFDRILPRVTLEAARPRLDYIEYHVDLPIEPSLAIRGAYFQGVSSIPYQRESTLYPQQIVIGSNPSLAVYDRKRRLEVTHEARPNAFPPPPEGNLSRYESRFKRGKRTRPVLHSSLQNVADPRDLGEHAALLASGAFRPFARMTFKDLSQLPIPSFPRANVLDESQSLEQIMAGYGRSIEARGSYLLEDARVYGMLEVASYQIVRRRCQDSRLAEAFNRLDALIPEPYSLGSLCRRSVCDYFGLPYVRPRLRPTRG